MEEIKNQGTVGQEMTNKEPSMPQRLAPGETSTTTQPERLSGETYTYTHYENTVTLVSEVRVYNQATQNYSYDYAYDEALFVHLQHESNISVSQISDILKGAALETVGSRETITFEDNSSYSREFTGGYVLSTYDSEGWLIDRTSLEVREDNNVVVASDVNGGSGNNSDTIYHMIHNATLNRDEIFNDNNVNIGSAPPTEAQQVKDFLELFEQGVSVIGGVVFVIRDISDNQWLLNKISHSVDWVSSKLAIKIGARTVVKCLSWTLRAFVILTIIDAATYVYTYFFTDNPRTLTDIIIDAIFGEDEQYVVNTNNGGNNQGGNPNGGGSGGSGSGGGGSNDAGVIIQYPDSNSSITIDYGLNTGIDSGLTEYTYRIVEVFYQVNTLTYDPDNNWIVNATMHKVEFGPIIGMGTSSYDSMSSLSDAIAVPSNIYGLSNVGRYSVKYAIYRNNTLIDYEWKHFDDDTITTTPQGGFFPE